MQHISVNKAVAAVVIAGTIVAACAGDDDSGADDSGVDVEADLDSGRSGNDGEAGDAEGEFTDPATTIAPDIDPGASASTESAEDSEAVEESADAATAEESDFDAEFDPGEDRSAPLDAEGGLFDESPDAEDPFDDNRFQDYGYREFVATADDPLSTFALDVDTGSYSIARRYLAEGALPPVESVRPEEFVNSFDYDLDAGRNGLDITVDGGPSPFAEENVLVRVGVQGEPFADEIRGPAALTFVIDTSGSMDRDDRLGLVKESLGLMVEELEADDTVAIVTYSDDSGIVLEPTPVSDRDRILDAIDDLGPGGSTNLESGLREGYDLAREAFADSGINRVVLASDGVANSGVTDPDELAAMIRDDADSGIDLVTVGFGLGNYNDVTMEQLADNGDGFYAYVDTIDEAERLFEEDLTSTLVTVAKDAKIQVEFDEQFVESYRLIGFENRGVRDSDFRDDDVDAGELGAGHQVTAMYELDLVDDVGLDDRAELGIVALRWEDPDTGEVTEIDEDVDLRDIEPAWADTSDDFQLATVVATFAEKLRDNPFADDVDIEALSAEANRLAEVLETDVIDELADLIETAADLSS